MYVYFVNAFCIIFNLTIYNFFKFIILSCTLSLRSLSFSPTSLYRCCSWMSSLPWHLSHHCKFRRQQGRVLERILRWQRYPFAVPFMLDLIQETMGECHTTSFIQGKLGAYIRTENALRITISFKL